MDLDEATSEHEVPAEHTMPPMPRRAASARGATREEAPPHLAEIFKHEVAQLGQKLRALDARMTSLGEQSVVVRTALQAAGAGALSQPQPLAPRRCKSAP